MMDKHLATSTPVEILGGRKLGELSPEEMEKFLSAIPRTKHMREDTYLGVEFMQWLLKNHGVSEVVQFVEKMNRILDVEGAISRYDLEGPPPEKDAARELSPAEQAFKKMGSKGMSRRHFFRTGGWVIPGITSTVYGGSKTIGEVVGFFSKKHLHKPPAQTPAQMLQDETSVFDRIADWTSSNAVPPTEALLGVALIYEGTTEWRKIRLEQISNVVAEIADAAHMQRNGVSQRKHAR